MSSRKLSRTPLKRYRQPSVSSTILPRAKKPCSRKSIKTFARKVAPLQDITNKTSNCRPSTLPPKSKVEVGNTLGLFCKLPIPIIHSIFDLLDCGSLGELALSSKCIGSLVEAYIYTKNGEKRLLPSTIQSDEAESCCKKFQDFGLLVKRLTMHRPVRYRLKTASYFLKKLEECKPAAVCSSSLASKCFGNMLHTFVKGWSEYNRKRVYALVLSTVNLESKVKKVLNSSPGSLKDEENDIGFFFNGLFLDLTVEREDDYAFWLTQILKPWPLTYQAKLLYILMAPRDIYGAISWTQACGCSSLQHLDCRVDFSKLANALKVMCRCRSRDWSEDDIISIVDELTAMPNSWCLENVSQLLMLCGTEITKGVLGSRAVSGRVDELCILSYYLISACVMADETSKETPQNIRWCISIFKYIAGAFTSAKDRKHYTGGLMKTYKEYLEGLFDESGSDSDQEDLREEFTSTVESLTLLSSGLLEIATGIADPL